jgi:hypothetical protein
MELRRRMKNEERVGNRSLSETLFSSSSYVNDTNEEQDFRHIFMPKNIIFMLFYLLFFD